ncbi:corA: magnesium and cobalt transport protein CorA [Rubrobacter radiotolerans]|uniref:Magnesium transport protein CorA n=1 Tax=Rubrobacter radiotolerans TaxID=42256 RepID=A0A023X1Q5_RUBRA|nr:magnesium/cobalt transporter CorA [Rubrobacter radiotolerans]AHY46273.1 corA: magnesium and cobalt transport protein CorA [Rubrobacter radiotolerans]MDX5893681.1 magnesium/cobalt transporter CorA [Rubrobacter radiotolerans]SMC04261.1 magnesium transporter [Rubrobacter radiotolerans DSM 5868]
MTIVDSAVYVDGNRAEEPHSLAKTHETARERGGVAWIGLYKPTEEELLTVSREFVLHELAIEDAVAAHQRPKIERYESTLFVVLKAARYLGATEEVEFSEVHVFVGRDFVVTIRHGEAPDLRSVRRRMEREPDLLRRGSEAILYAVMDRVVDDYYPVVRGLENAVDEIEAEVFGGNPDVSERIYKLSREVIEFQRAVKPLGGILKALTGGFEKYGIDEELRRYLRDVQDHAVEVIERVESFRQLLQNILSVNLALVGLQQNEEVKRLSEVGLQQNDEVKRVSAWAAILFAPTLIGTVYGMNFDHMPELHWIFGYPFALSLMALVCIVLYVLFSRRGWL